MFADVFRAGPKKLPYDAVTIQASAHLLAVEGLTPKRSAQARQERPARRQRRIRVDLDSVALRSSRAGSSRSTAAHASRQVKVIG